jgi:hypothetical protein
MCPICEVKSPNNSGAKPADKPNPNAPPKDTRGLTKQHAHPSLPRPDAKK